jgi:hypothetical protein
MLDKSGSSTDYFYKSFNEIFKMREFIISSAKMTATLCLAGFLTACADRNDSNNATLVSQLASDPTSVCSVSPDNHSSALCYRIGDNTDQQLKSSKYSGNISSYVDSKALTKIKLEMDGGAQITLQTMANGTGKVNTHHAGMSSSTYQTTTGDYYTQTASSDEDGGTVTFTSFSSVPGERMQGHFDVKLCKYSISTHISDCVNNMIQLIGAFDVGVADPACSVSPTENNGAICYQIGSNETKTTNSDNQSLLQAYFETYDNTTRVSLVPSPYDGQLNLQTAGAVKGESDLSSSGNTYYDNGTGYVRSSSSNVDGGSITFMEYGVVGERVKGHFAANLCKYGYNPLYNSGQHGAIDCDNATIWIRGRFDIPRTADKYTVPQGR